MGYLPPGTILGYRGEIGDPADADIRAGLGFGNRSGEVFPIGPPNMEIAYRIIQDQAVRTLPIVGSRNVTRGIHILDSKQEIMESFDSHLSQDGDRLAGTYEHLELLKGFMLRGGYNTAALYTVAYAMGNVIRQADMLELDYVIPPNMPKGFDPKSEQPNTQNWISWVCLSVFKMHNLRKRGH